MLDWIYNHPVAVIAFVVLYCLAGYCILRAMQPGGWK
jgi:hypothetical protein